MLDDLLAFNPVQVHVDARFGFMCALCSDEDQVSLSQQKLYFIDGPMLHENFDIAQELCDTIAYAGFVPDHKIASEEFVLPAVVPGDVKDLVIFRAKALFFSESSKCVASAGPSSWVCPLLLGGAAGVENAQCSAISPPLKR